MPFIDVIRGIFGLPSPEKFNQSSGFRKPNGIGDNEVDDNNYENDVIIIDDDRHGSPFGFNVFSGNLLDMHRYFQQQMDEMMKTFDSPWFSNPDGGNFFGITDNKNFGDTIHPETEEELSPRNKFLKPMPESKNDLHVQDEDEEIQTPHHSKDSFNFFSGDPLEIHKFFEQQIDDIMKRFSSSPWFHLDEGNMLDLPDKNPVRSEESVHPRNKFFKPSYEQPQGVKVDSDIDNESYAPNVIGKLLDKEPVRPPTSSFISRSLMTTHQKKIFPNGGVEERRKCVKDGKEEVTVSRQLGDLKHVVTTVKLPDGTTTKNEEFINFDEGQLGDFNKSWNKL